jgi:hypothetical protein
MADVEECLGTASSLWQLSVPLNPNTLHPLLKITLGKALGQEKWRQVTTQESVAQIGVQHFASVLPCWK